MNASAVEAPKIIVGVIAESVLLIGAVEIVLDHAVEEEANHQCEAETTEIEITGETTGKDIEIRSK